MVNGIEMFSSIILALVFGKNEPELLIKKEILCSLMKLKQNSSNQITLNFPASSPPPKSRRVTGGSQLDPTLGIPPGIPFCSIGYNHTRLLARLSAS